MGQMRFLVPHRDRLTPQAIRSAHLRGQDDLPWVCRVTLNGSELLIERNESESGTFHILWPAAQHGTLLLSTATLKERPLPYQLPVELARGTLNRLRNQLAAWQMNGFELPPNARGTLHEALRQFVAAATSQSAPERAAAIAENAIDTTLAAMKMVAAAYAEAIVVGRLHAKPRIIPLFAGRLGGSVPVGPMAAAFASAFNAAIVPFSWSVVESDEGRKNWSLYDAQVQWCQSQGLRICGGPLVELQRRSLPDWLFLWEGDFENLLAVAGDHVRAVVSRYRGKVAFWNVAGRLMTGEALGLDDEQKLRLVVRVIEVVRSVDSNTPVIVSFDQPWAEFMARQEADLTPMYFADALVRAELGVAGIGVEMGIGFQESATLPRDWLEFGRHLDRWSLLGLPLLVSLAVPSAGQGFSSQSQQAWLQSYLPCALARPSVQGIFWNQWLDSETDDFPGTGFVDAAGKAKPALAELAHIRKRFTG
ncbi:MAG: endo-1,4-beta-xylanase [Pirellulales bacterium]|nr:endo-1,4-beta-xylanase [Pirellulales bacterium]